jgi:hypothetical protein
VPVGSAPSTIRFSEALASRHVSIPELKFQAALREAPGSARFWVAVDSLGIARYSFLDESSGDSSLDEQARRYLTFCRFQPLDDATKNSGLTWAMAIFDFGTDLQLPPGPAERAP